MQIKLNLSDRQYHWCVILIFVPYAAGPGTEFDWCWFGSSFPQIVNPSIPQCYFPFYPFHLGACITVINGSSITADLFHDYVNDIIKKGQGIYSPNESPTDRSRCQSQAGGCEQAAELWGSHITGWVFVTSAAPWFSHQQTLHVQHETALEVMVRSTRRSTHIHQIWKEPAGKFHSTIVLQTICLYNIEVLSMYMYWLWLN